MEENKTYYYAQLDENNICVVVGTQPIEVDSENMIPIEGIDTNLLGKRYDNGSWAIVEKENTEEPINENELLQAEMLLNQMTLIEKQNEQDEVLAEILLNQMEG